MEKITKSDFIEMVRDYIADNAEEMADLVIDSTVQEAGAWKTYAHDSKATYELSDKGDGNIAINYVGSRS